MMVTLDHISHAYVTKQQTTLALKDVSLSIQEGEFVSFIGPSGCGKTTLLSIIAGLIKPTEGHVKYVSNKGITGYMLQHDYLFPWKTINENILLGLSLKGSIEKADEELAHRLLKEVDLLHTKDLYPYQLSGGMRQRAALVRTLVVQPSILLLDEPFSALDYQTKLKLENLVVDLLKEYGKTAILVTHDIGESIAMSDRVFLFSPNPGRLHKEFVIPDTLKDLTPFEARNHREFPSFFK